MEFSFSTKTILSDTIMGDSFNADVRQDITVEWLQYIGSNL